MSCVRLITFYLIFELISYSYELHIKTNNGQRYTRDALLKNDTRQLLKSVSNDQQELEVEVKKSIQNDEKVMEEIVLKITNAADRMAEAGAKDIKSVEEWKHVLEELRKGIRLIIDAYQRYIVLHRDVCESVEHFAKSMIAKYENELAAIDKMPIPTTEGNTVNTNSKPWVVFISKFVIMLNYARTHQQTLQTATDSANDLTMNTLAHQSTILNRPSTVKHRINIKIAHQTRPQYPPASFSVPCGEKISYNGDQTCSNGIADATQTYANSICCANYM